MRNRRNRKFVLCPRGYGVSSWRLFEAMKAGRVPVVISDQWVPPDGPDWAACSLRVAERDVARIPAVLEERERDSEEMGRAARRQWEEWFSEEVAFHRVVEWCRSIVKGRAIAERWARLPVYLELLRPHHFRHRLLWRVRTSLSRGIP